MKKYILFFAVILFSSFAINSCKEDEKIQEDAYLTVTPASLSTGYEGGIYEFAVKSNCGWTITKNDASGDAITWVKSDMSNGKNNVTLRLKVYENPNGESRTAVVKIESDDVTAYIDVAQDANPDPDTDPDPDPDPEPEPTEGCVIPLYQIIESNKGLDCVSGAISTCDWDFANASYSGNVITFTNGVKMEKKGSDANFLMAWPCHTNPKLNAGFQNGFCASWGTGDYWVISIPMKDALSGDFRFTYGSRKENISTADAYGWSLDGENWNPVTKMAAGVSDAAFKHVWFTIPESSPVPAGGTLYIKIAAAPTAGLVYFQNGFTLDKALAEKSSVPAQDNTSVVISDGFDDVLDAAASYVEVPGFLKTVTTGYASATADKSAYAPTNTSLSVNHCFARPGFLQIGYNDEAVVSRCGINGTLSIAVGDRLKEMGISKADLKVSFKVAGMTNAYNEKCDAVVIIKNGDATAATVSGLTYDTWSDQSLTVKDADQSSVLVITSEASTAKVDNGKADYPCNAADYRFFIDDLIITVGDSTPDTPKEPIELSFDFTRTDLGWPESKSVNWSTLKDCDSGLAGDNGGTATENTHRRASVTYTIDGTGYDFVLADPDGATAHNVYLSSGKGVYSGTLRYLGLPVISGYKLANVTMVQNASTKDPASFTRNVGISSNISDAEDSGIIYVGGGECQNQYTNGETYTYSLSGTNSATRYYLHSPTNASIIKSLVLKYEAE